MGFQARQAASLRLYSAQCGASLMHNLLVMSPACSSECNRMQWLIYLGCFHCTGWVLVRCCSECGVPWYGVAREPPDVFSCGNVSLWHGSIYYIQLVIPCFAVSWAKHRHFNITAEQVCILVHCYPMLSSGLHMYGLSYTLQMVRVFSIAIVCDVQQQWLALYCIVGIFGRFRI